MKTKWQQEQLSRLPSEFEKVNETTYIQRKNVIEIPPDENNPSTRYQCQSRFISSDIFDELSSPAHEEMKAEFSKVRDAQTASEDSTLVVMEALADIGVLLLEMGGGI